jgi:putative methyltransferase (TIGR04325 family)
MKTLLKRYIPSFLLKASKPIIPDQPVAYKTYEEATTASQNGAYENNDLVKVVVEKNLLYKKKFQADAVFDLPALRTLIAIGLSKTRSSLNVIDFGGGGGYHYTIASNALGGQDSLRWNVVETTAMTNEAQRIANKNLKFFDNIIEAKNDLESVDLVFTSSALQYCPNPLTFLKQLTEINAKYLFITRTPFTDIEEDIFSSQVSQLSANGPGPLPPGYTDRKITYPITYVSKSKVEKILKEKYLIQFTITEDKAVYSVGNKEIDLFGYFCVRKS